MSGLIDGVFKAVQIVENKYLQKTGRNIWSRISLCVVIMFKGYFFASYLLFGCYTFSILQRNFLPKNQKNMLNFFVFFYSMRLL